MGWKFRNELDSHEFADRIAKDLSNDKDTLFIQLPVTRQFVLVFVRTCFKGNAESVHAKVRTKCGYDRPQSPNRGGPVPFATGGTRRHVRPITLHAHDNNFDEYLMKRIA
jgi:hypothetical protein